MNPLFGSGVNQGMQAGEQWRNRKTLDLVRVEVAEFGMVSFSVLQGKRWLMCPFLWDEEQFRIEFEPHKYDA